MQSKYCGWFFPYPPAGSIKSRRPNLRRGPTSKTIRKESRILMRKSDHRPGLADNFKDSKSLTLNTHHTKQQALSLESLGLIFGVPGTFGSLEVQGPLHKLLSLLAICRLKDCAKVTESAQYHRSKPFLRHRQPGCSSCRNRWLSRLHW